MQPPESASESATRRYQFDIFADYHLVYLEDCRMKDEEIAGLIYDPGETAEQFAARMRRLEQSADRTDSLVTPEARARHLGITQSTLCIHTARPMPEPVTIEIRDSPPPEDWAGWDFVIEASLDLPSGCLVIHPPAGAPEDPHIEVEPGMYRARVYYGGIATVSADEMNGDDHYLVALWPAPSAKPTVLYAGITRSW